MAAKTDQMLRVGKLAKLAGVSPSTIKHYVQEGLLPRPIKTGKTSAYYDPACVDRIKLIKRLQKEKYLPLEMIKRLLDSGAADVEEEVEIGRQIVKSGALAQDGPPVGQARIERRTGYPLERIRLLERRGLIEPVEDKAGKAYDAVDCQIIAIARRREEMGLPLDFALETMSVYREAIETAVEEDVRRFVRYVLGRDSTPEVLKLLDRADEDLDRFIALTRQKLIRKSARRAIQQWNRLKGELAHLNFLPVKGDELPASPPARESQAIFHLFCRGEFAALADKADIEAARRPRLAAEAVLARLAQGDHEAALALAERWLPRPTARPLDNLAAGLACIFSSAAESGLSRPMALAGRALAFFERNLALDRGGGLQRALNDYLIGAVYTSLPDVLDTLETGLSLLTDLEKRLRAGKLAKGRLPGWLSRTLDFEIFPEVEIRVNRYLAQAFSRRGDKAAMRAALERLADLAGPDHLQGAWARRRLLEAA